MSAAAATLLWLASCAVAQKSSINDPLTGEPIPLIKGSDFRRRRKLEVTCPEAIDEVGETFYHPTLDRHAGPVCTNSNNFPQAWKEIPIANTIAQYLSPTAKECCEKYFAVHGVAEDDCITEDVCAEKPVYWHSSKDNPSICTNSGDYPLAWDKPSLKRYHLFKDPEDCCMAVENKYGEKCDYRDVFEPWNCNKWHLSIETDDNNNLVNQDGACTNSGVIHESWLFYKQHYVFPNHQACCDKFNISADKCAKVDMCVDGELPSNPIKMPTDTQLSICPQIWTPVCGEDGITYSNDCEASKMSAKVAYEGECLEELSDEHSGVICAEIWAPVCGEDGKVYSNECEASKMSVEVAYEGECLEELSDEHSGVICVEIWAPVCGEDGEVYSNECEANKMSVKVAYEGECRKQDQGQDLKEISSEKCSPGGFCAEEGSTCAVGTETCCGVTHDSLKCDCTDGRWMCIATDACMMPCSPTAQPVSVTTTVAATTATTTAAEEIVTHSAELCGKWHISREDANTCTNSGVGTNEPPADCTGWYQTGEDCCEEYFGVGECNKMDISVTTTQATPTSDTVTSSTVENAIICTKIYAPVCGEDGKVYSNECEASKMSVKVAYEGKCQIQDDDQDLKEISSEKCSPGGVCSEEGSTCAVGTETCCGVTHDSLKCDCTDGRWMCIVTEACMMPCSPTAQPVSVTTTVAATTTTTTAAEEIVTHSTELCGKWHISREDPNTCTNSGVGTEEPPADCTGWYQTGEDCCGSYFGTECSMIDDLSESSTKPAISPCNEWHIDEKNPRICTNSEDYPSIWRENHYSKFFFSSPEACCEQISDCRAADVCALCSEEYSPVCGSNKMTYENECKAKAAGMIDYVEGECELKTTSTMPSSTTPAATTTANPDDMEENSDSLLDSPFCTEEYSPVCGSDKMTYDNKCKARAAGVLNFVEGKCNFGTTSSTTPVTTTSSTTSITTTSSNPGDMEQNSDSLTTNECDNLNRRQCRSKKNKKNGCKWSNSSCYLKYDEEKIGKTSKPATNETCSTWKKRSKCEGEGCVWSRKTSKSRKGNCYAPARRRL